MIAANLTPREYQVLFCIADGLSNKEIGRLLEISPRTVEVHRARAMEKLGARNAAHLVRIALSDEIPIAKQRVSPRIQALSVAGMSAKEFKEFLEERALTVPDVAHLLGSPVGLVEGYTKGAPVPMSIVLALRHLDSLLRPPPTW